MPMFCRKCNLKSLFPKFFCLFLIRLRTWIVKLWEHKSACWDTCVSGLFSLQMNISDGKNVHLLLQLSLAQNCKLDFRSRMTLTGTDECVKHVILEFGLASKGNGFATPTSNWVSGLRWDFAELHTVTSSSTSALSHPQQFPLHFFV